MIVIERYDFLKRDRHLDRLVATGLAAAVWVIICFAVFIGLDGTLSLVAVLLCCLFVYASFMLWKTVFDKHSGPLGLMFWLFHTNYFFLPAVSQSLYRSFFWSSYDAYKEESLLYVCILVALGLSAFSIGEIYGRRKLVAGANGKIFARFFSARLSETWLLTAFLIIILIGLVGLVSILGVEFFTSSRMSKVDQVESLAELGMLLSLPRALAVGVLLFSVALLVQMWRQDRTIPFIPITLFLVALSVNSIINFPLSLSRFWLFGFLISLFWLVISLRSALMRAAFVVIMTILQFTMLPWFSQVTRDMGLLGFDIESIRQYVRYGDFDGFQTMANIIVYINEEGFEFGRNLVSAVLFFVPRTIWEYKAEPLGVAASQHMGYSFTNLSAPIYGELYADIGVTSLVIGMGLMGFYISRFDSYYKCGLMNKQITVGVLITSVLAGYLIILLRGSLLGVLPGIATLMGVLVTASLLGHARDHMRTARIISRLKSNSFFR